MLLLLIFTKKTLKDTLSVDSDKINGPAPFHRAPATLGLDKMITEGSWMELDP